MKRPLRRTILKGAALAWVVSLSGLLRSAYTWAAEWPKTAFESKKIDEVLQNLFGTTQVASSTAIKITAPFQAENGATVRFAVSTTLPDVSSITILVEKNDRPLITSFNLSGALPFLSLRMKMAQTSDVHAVVRSAGKLYGAKHNIKVTVGGCGG